MRYDLTDSVDNKWDRYEKLVFLFLKLKYNHGEVGIHHFSPIAIEYRKILQRTWDI